MESGPSDGPVSPGRPRPPDRCSDRAPAPAVLPMSPAVALALVLALLSGPWVLMPRRRVSRDDRGFKWVYWWLNAAYCAFWHRLRLRFRDDDPLPPEGPAILISNHPCCID